MISEKNGDDAIMITLEGVSKSYRTSKGYRVILDDVSLLLPTDRNIGVLGRNGAGKSTLLRLISGEEEPDTGRIKREARVSWPLGFTGGFHPALTGRENLRFVSRIYNCDIDEVTAYVEGFSELGDYFDMPISTLSSGMRARLAFGLSLAMQFEFYLIDELVSVGDAWFREKAQAEFERIRSESGMLLVSHNPTTIRKFCDSGLVLRDGQLTIFDSLDDAVDYYLDDR
jgi:capsular polysaccharide transport system ATP-binding protein